MLNYSNILQTKDKEVRDPVSGNSYPMSLSDVHAIERQKASQAKTRNLALTLLSMVK